MCGDAHQRLYGHQVVLSRCGIDIRGRGKKLRINYRTTEEIKNWSNRLLHGQSFDDLDTGIDEDTAVRSIVHGQAPDVHPCASVAAMTECVAEQVRATIAGGANPANICVVAATHREIDSLVDPLKKVCAEISKIETGMPDTAPSSALRVATIYRVKGLEFDHVVLVGKLSGYGTPEITKESRSLLYVAATRARKSLTVCHLNVR